MTRTTVTANDEIVTVRPDEDVVAGAVERLREVLRGALARNAREIVLDLANVKRLDSCGIGLLLAAHNSLCKSGGGLRVVRASGEIVETLRALRIHHHIGVAGA